MSYCIYKIVCDDLPDFIYVGSTKAFRQRKREHKSRVNKDNQILYTTIKENGGWDKWRMVCIEECDEIIDSKRKAEAKEEEWRMKLNANMNMRRCYITKEEAEERDRLHRQKQYQENKQYFQDKYKKENMTEEQYERKKARARESYYKNREEILRKARERYHNNK